MLLDEIVAAKRVSIANIKSEQFEPFLNDLEPPRDLFSALMNPAGRMAVIAEIKKASPSAGLLVDKYVPDALAALYEKAGASAISVITEENFFQGRLEDLKKAKAHTKLPVLRKDFILEEVQVLESRAAGADAILLIVRILSPEKLKALFDFTRGLGMQALVEVHSAVELEQALSIGAEIIGINNRDLDTLQVDLLTTIDIMDDYPELEEVVSVSESGIQDYDQIELLLDKGVRAVLVGEAILRADSIEEKIQELRGGDQ